MLKEIEKQDLAQLSRDAKQELGYFGLQQYEPKPVVEMKPNIKKPNPDFQIWSHRKGIQTLPPIIAENLLNTEFGARVAGDTFFTRQYGLFKKVRDKTKSLPFTLAKGGALCLIAIFLIAWWAEFSEAQRMGWVILWALVCLPIIMALLMTYSQTSEWVRNIENSLSCHTSYLAGSQKAFDSELIKLAIQINKVFDCTLEVVWFGANKTDIPAVNLPQYLKVTLHETEEVYFISSQYNRSVYH